MAVMDEQDDGLDRLNDLDVTWGFDQHTLFARALTGGTAGGDAGDGTAETMNLSQAGVDTFSAPTGGGSKESRRWTRLKGAPWAPPQSRQGGPKQSRRWIRLKGVRWTPPRSRQGRAEQSRGWILLLRGRGGRFLDPGREGQKRLRRISSWKYLRTTLRDRTQGQIQRLEGESAQRQLWIQHEIEDALSAAVKKWT